MAEALPLKVWVGAISILLTLSALANPRAETSSSAGGVNCVADRLRRDFSKSSTPRISIENLTSEIAARRARVPEFEFIRKEAEKRGLRVWLFGGTAAGYGHYVKWDLLREAGDLRFQKDRFDYDYTNIYRSTQDLDIVVDGSAEQAQEFQQALQTRFPYFMGSKATPWEVRSLRESSGDKGAILDDFSFMNQHTDSNSTGMIELTDPPKSESVVRDVRDWKNAEISRFLKDLHEGRLTYYFSSTHGKTTRAKEGRNPPIFSVIRALTKAFQYELEIRPEDLAIMKREIDRFSPAKDIQGDAQRWIEKNGKKLYQHAVDIEYASNTLDQLGLKQKLIAIQNNPKSYDSLAWWMSKEPLKSKAVGKGAGKTAKELGLDIVAHETRGFLAYESMTRAHTGEPNVLISRQGVVGETAALGDGFYTRIGTKGAVGSGITIRFKVDPNAREGEDFFRTGEYVIWQNKSAIRVIPESLEMTPSRYFEFLAEGKEISVDDKALIWKLKRRFGHQFAAGLVDPNELKKVRTLVMEKVQARAPNHKLLFQEWVALEAARAGKPPHEVDAFVHWIQTEFYRVDPGPVVDGLSHLAHGTEMESWINEQYIPSILKSLKLDIGENAIENALESPQPSLRKFALRALAYAEEERPSPRITMLRQLVNERPSGPIDRQAAKAWLRDDLEKNSSLPVFEKILKKDAKALAVLREAQPESFQFLKFDLPKGGKKLRLSSFEDKGGRTLTEPIIRVVVLKRPFEIQSTPVTQLQWLAVMGKNPSHFHVGGDVINGIPLNPNRPVENVSWNDVQNFIKKLNKLDPHYEYRLPTDQEWEASVRGGTDTKYSFGGNPMGEALQYGWHFFNSNMQTHDVASLKPNPMGLYDMHGNVAEWVQDLFVSNGFTGTARVTRGGHFQSTAYDFLSSARNYEIEKIRGEKIGFRLVRVPKDHP